jgi:multidrug resistance efflux pump
MEKCVAAFLLLNVTPEQAEEALVRLKLTADTPGAYLLGRELVQARTDVEKVASVLDVMVEVNAEKRFLAATLALCNALATRFACDRVSLGWLKGGYIRLKSISRTEKFNRHMEAVKELETAMEESFDQDEEIVWPAPEHSNVITRDHSRFAEAHRSGHVCSVPFRLDQKPIAVLTCERVAKPFTAAELQQFRLACDQSIRRLADLEKHDKWFGARLAAATREKLSAALGPEHTWAKALAVTGVLTLVILFLPIFSYRVESNFILRSDDVSFLTAPFEGYISKVVVRPGDTIESGGLLLQLDTTDLELEEVAAIADLSRFTRESEKARAANQLAEMRIAQAQAGQSQARLDLIRHRLNQAAIRSPYEGVLVEGDLRQRIGAPVKQGEALLKVARLSTLYIEAEVNERDIHEIIGRRTGEIAFVTQPKLKFPIAIERIEPAALAKDGQNVFLVRCDLEQDPEPWWRPGMSGVCKLNVEKRTLFWIISHRTVDFLRMLFWW